jgi:hypothetical protein
MTDVRIAKERLEAERKVARAEAERMIRERLENHQRNLDLAVRIALSAGATRTALADAAGESRVTINERLDRTANIPIDTHTLPDLSRTDKRRTKTRTAKPEAEKRSWPYTIEGDSLIVNYEEYGPDMLTGRVKFELIYEELDDSWGLIVQDFADEADAPTIAEYLDMTFTGWYYDDVTRFIKEVKSNG